MEKRYLVEGLVAVGPDDDEWQPDGELEEVGFVDLHDALVEAKHRIKLTEHGKSGVRVWDCLEDKEVWSNITSGNDPETEKEE